jgi:hypothetical protein
MYGAKNMNMISTGAFQTEMDASDKQPTLAKKFAAVWEKKNAKAARAGGVSLMALSLAACGSDSTTTTATTTTTTTATTTVTPTVTPISSALTIVADTITGTTANDTVTGGRIDTIQAFNSNDSIDLGAGTDGLSATLGAGTVRPAKLAGIETLTFSAIGAATVDMDNATGVTSIVSQGSTTTLLVDDIQAIPTSISVNNNSAAQSFRVKDAILTGSTDSITLNLDGAGAAVNLGSESDVDGDFETINIVAEGGNSDLVAGQGFGADATTIKVTGSADLDLGSGVSFAKVTDFDASAATGDVDVVIANRAAAGETAVSIKMGSGADVVDMGALVAANRGDTTVDMGAGNDSLDIAGIKDQDTGSSYDGGAGTDTLTIATAILAAADFARISNFEILVIESTGLTQDADNFTGTTFQTGAALANFRIDDLADDSTFNANHNITTALALNIKTDTASDAVTVNVGGTAGGVTVTALTPSTTYETVTVNSQGTTANVLTAVGAVINNFTFTGATALTVSSTNNITGVVDFTASTGNNIVTVTDTTTQTISFGGGADTLTASGVVASAQTQIINGGAGADTLTAGNVAAGGTLNINGDAGSDTISYNAANTGASVHNVNGGTGIDFITLGQHASSLDDVISTATLTADGDEVTGFVTTKDDFDYNGTVKNDAATTITAVSNATLAGGLAADADATVYIVSTALTGAAQTDSVALVAESTVVGVTTDYATFEASFAASLGTVAGLDSTIASGESVLINADDGTNSVIMRFVNSDTSTANTVTAAELELVAVMVAADDLVTGDYI